MSLHVLVELLAESLAHGSVVRSRFVDNVVVFVFGQHEFKYIEFFFDVFFKFLVACENLFIRVNNDNGRKWIFALNLDSVTDQSSSFDSTLHVGYSVFSQLINQLFTVIGDVCEVDAILFKRRIIGQTIAQVLVDVLAQERCGWRHQLSCVK